MGKKPWLRIDDYGADGVVTLKGVPKINPNGKLYPYTLIAVDESGLSFKGTVYRSPRSQFSTKHYS